MKRRVEVGPDCLRAVDEEFDGIRRFDRRKFDEVFATQTQCNSTGGDDAEFGGESNQGFDDTNGGFQNVPGCPATVRNGLVVECHVPMFEGIQAVANKYCPQGFDQIISGRAAVRLQRHITGPFRFAESAQTLICQPVFPTLDLECDDACGLVRQAFSS